MSYIAYCDVNMYDLIYEKIVQQALSGEISMNERNNSIEALRKLCRGQRSTFERGIYEKQEEKLPSLRQTVPKRGSP